MLQDWANIASITEVILWIAASVIGGTFAVGYITKMRPIWKRFTSNIKRQVAVISTEKQDMTYEAELLNEIGYFKDVKLFPSTPKSLDLVKGSSVIVVGYSKNSPTYARVFEYAKANKLPIIVYSGKNWLETTDKEALKDYSFSSICETDLRLVSDVFNVMSTNVRPK